MQDKRTLAGQTNTKQASTTVNNIDRVGPTVSVTFKKADGNGYSTGSWSTQDIIQTLSGTDTGGSYVAYYQYSNDKSQAYTINSTYTWQGEWNKDFYYRAVDGLGNEGDWIGPYNLKIDKTAPSQTTYSGGHSNSWMTADYTVELSSTDDVSGIARYEYSTDGSTGWTTISSPYTYSSDGNLNHYYRAVNGAGIAGVASEVNHVMLDKTGPSAPTFSNTSMGSWARYYTGTISSSDNVSGISGYEYHMNSGSWAAATASFTISTNRNEYFLL